MYFLVFAPKADIECAESVVIEGICHSMMKSDCGMRMKVEICGRREATKKSSCGRVLPSHRWMTSFCQHTDGGCVRNGVVQHAGCTARLVMMWVVSAEPRTPHKSRVCFGAKLPEEYEASP
jgi:hypothetical protein